MSTEPNKAIASYQDLIVWQRAMDLVDLVYRHSSRWPTTETYGLTAQIRRAAVSVPANIAEGNGRNGRREFAHHLSIAHGSLCEVETMLFIANRQTFLGADHLHALLTSSGEVGRLLNGLYRSLTKSSGS